jgi:hypothetical protein
MNQQWPPGAEPVKFLFLCRRVRHFLYQTVSATENGRVFYGDNDRFTK